MGLVPILKGTGIIIGIPNQQRLALAARLDYSLKPQIQCVVQIYICQNWGNYTARTSRCRVQDLPVNLQDTRFQPLANESKKRLIIDPEAQRL